MFKYIFMISAKRRYLALVIHLLTELTNKMKLKWPRWLPLGTPPGETDIEIKDFNKLFSVSIWDNFSKHRSAYPIHADSRVLIRRGLCRGWN